MKKLIINESQEEYLAKQIAEEKYQMPVPKKANKPYCVNPEKVLIVKKFLDSTFTPHDYEKIGANGLPEIVKVVSMNAKNGEPLKYMYQDQLLDLLIDKFQKMFSDVDERQAFLKQVMSDWLGGKIGVFGNLSVNSLNEVTNKEVTDEANNANTNPTDPQLEAGNYKKGHISVKGMRIAIENPKGSKRSYKDKNGETKYNIMKNHYGYFNVTKGKDGDAVDVFLGPNIEDFDTVYCIDQKIKGKFDETKVMLGFSSKEEAKEAYLSNYSPDWKGFMYITAVSLPVFKKWLYRGRKQRIPFAKYVEIRKKRLNEVSDAIAKKALREDAYIGSQDTKHKTLNVNYEKGRVWGKRLSNDFLRTDRMDNTNSGTDTYEVPLKGGITSYNITSINGTEVMHYFKNYFSSKKKTNVKVKDEKGHEEEYELKMKEQEFKNFLNTFSAKVNAVVNYHIKKIRQENPKIKFSGIAIYPVPSSSNFNEKMAEELQKNVVPIGGFKNGVVIVNSAIFNKDLANLKRDKTFIKNNKDYYNSIAYTNRKEGISATSNQMLDTALSKFQAFKKAKEYIEQLSEIARQIIALRNRRNYIKQETYEQNLATLYADYYNTYITVLQLGEYYNYETGEVKRQNKESLLTAIKYSKGPSIEHRSEDTWKTVSKYLRGAKDINGNPYKKIELAIWEPRKFEIKKLPNNVRMGLMGYYSKNDEKFAEEAKKIKNRIFVVFDDNISGGATLSDICYLAKENGIEHIIPITFGQMATKETMGVVPILQPKGGQYRTNFKY